MTLGLSDCKALGPSTKHTAFHFANVLQDLFSFYSDISTLFRDVHFELDTFFTRVLFVRLTFFLFILKHFLSREDNFVPYGKFLDHIVTVKIHFKGYCHLILKLTY